MSRPGVVREISLARASFDPRFPAEPTAGYSATGVRARSVTLLRIPGIMGTLRDRLSKDVSSQSGGIRTKFFSSLQIYHTGAGNCLPRRKFMAYHGVFILGVPMTMLDRMRRHKNWLKWSL